MKDWENVDAFSANDTRQAKTGRVCVFQSLFPVYILEQNKKRMFLTMTGGEQKHLFYVNLRMFPFLTLKVAL